MHHRCLFYATFSAKVNLNVGGKEIQTFRSVLTSIEGSMLNAMFSGRHELTRGNFLNWTNFLACFFWLTKSSIIF